MVPGTANFRDLGGTPARGGLQVRPGRLFRSDALSRLTPDGRAAIVEGLGVRLAVDLRSSAEVQVAPVDPGLSPPLVVRHIPLWDGTRPTKQSGIMQLPLSQKYGMLASIAMDQVREAVSALLEADAPAVVFCSAGKDRTGIVSAVLLGVLGASTETIVAEYAKTEPNTEAIWRRLAKMRGLDKTLGDLQPGDRHASPETMADFLDILREGFGGLDAYIEALGLSAAQREDARQRLLQHRT
jgi:protein-tyrosine phosphatase